MDVNVMSAACMHMHMYMYTYMYVGSAVVEP